MPESGFPIEGERLAATMCALLERQNKKKSATLLKSTSKVWIESTEYDNWNGGTTTYALILEVPIDTYAVIEPDQSSYESALLKVAQKLTDSYQNDRIGSVSIRSELSHDPTWRLTGHNNLIDKAEKQAGEIWGKEHGFRLFISHSSWDLEFVHKLRDSLAELGILAFVAHTSIKPTKKWLEVIESAILTMDAMAAILTENFRGSMWTDQECGKALGRNAVVIAVMKTDESPHGFLGESQAIHGKGKPVAVIATRIAEVLLENENTAARARESMCAALVHATSFNMSRHLSTVLARYSGYSSEQLSALLVASEDNYELKKGIGVPERVRSMVRKEAPHLLEPPKPAAVVSDEYDPFADE